MKEVPGAFDPRGPHGGVLGGVDSERLRVRLLVGALGGLVYGLLSDVPPAIAAVGGALGGLAFWLVEVHVFGRRPRW